MILRALRWSFKKNRSLVPFLTELLRVQLLDTRFRWYVQFNIDVFYYPFMFRLQVLYAASRSIIVLQCLILFSMVFIDPLTYLIAIYDEFTI